MKKVCYTILLIALVSFTAKAQFPGFTFYNINPPTSIALNQVASSLPSMLTAFKGKLYFMPFDTIDGVELYALDTVGQPQMVAELRPGKEWGVLLDGVKVNPNSPTWTLSRKMGIAKDANGVECLYFGGYGGPNVGYDLMKYDGINAPTLATEIVPGNSEVRIYDFVTLNNNLYFFTQLDTFGLFRYDPVANTVKKIFSDPQVSLIPGMIEAYKGAIYFPSKNELKQYDPVKDTVITVRTYPRDIWELKTVGSKLYFWAVDKVLYYYDGPSFSTDPKVLDKVCNTNNPNQYRLLLGEYKGQLVYPCPTQNGSCLPCMYDEVANKIHPLMDGAYPANFEEHQGSLFFSAGRNLNINVDTIGAELWEYNGVTNPKLVFDILPGVINGNLANSTVPQALRSVGGVLFYTGAIPADSVWGSPNNKPNDIEIIKYKPTPVGVKNIAFNGTVSAYPNPTVGDLYITVTAEKSEDLIVDLYDVTGKKLWSSSPLTINTSAQNITVPMKNLSQGTYIYRIKNKQGGTVYSGTIVRR